MLFCWQCIVCSISVPQISAFTSDCDFCIIIYCLWSRLKDCFCMCFGSQNVKLFPILFMQSSFWTPSALTTDVFRCLQARKNRCSGRRVHKSHCACEFQFWRRLKVSVWCFWRTLKLVQWKLWRCKAISFAGWKVTTLFEPSKSEPQGLFWKITAQLNVKKDESHFSSLRFGRKSLKTCFMTWTWTRKRFPFTALTLHYLSSGL